MASEVFDQRPADPGTQTSRALALLFAVLLGGALIVIQNAYPVEQVFTKGPTTEELAERAPDEIVPPTPADPFTLSARFAVQSQGMHPAFAGDPELTMETLDAWAVSPENRVRAAIVAGELLGADRALARLEELRDLFGEGTPLARDVGDLIAIYERASADSDSGSDSSDSTVDRAADDSTNKLIDDASADRLVAHHGFFGQVALTTGLDDTHPDREPLVTGGGKLAALLLGIGGGLVLVFGAGFCLFITAILLISMRKIRSGMGTPEPGGSVFLEAFAIFAGGFLLLMLSLSLLSRVVGDPTWLTVIQMCAQWMLLAAPLWPLMRGMRWHDFCRAIGWHKGKGVFREIGAGVLGYLAGLPLLALGIGITLGLVGIVTVLRQRAGLGEPPPPNNAVFELATSDSPLVLILVFLLATVWAPVCEESIFRGSLYRHMRGRVGIVFAAAASALVFGLCHAYGPVLVFPVVMLGVTFAFLREWRGSLIAPITAHALHNGTVTIVAYNVIKMIS